MSAIFLFLFLFLCFRNLDFEYEPMKLEIVLCYEPIWYLNQFMRETNDLDLMIFCVIYWIQHCIAIVKQKIIRIKWHVSFTFFPVYLFSGVFGKQ